MIYELGARRKWWKKPPKDVPQIPWAKEVVVTKLTEDEAILELPWVRAELDAALDRSFFSIAIDSKEFISDFMTLDEKLTEEFRDFFEGLTGPVSFGAAMRDWVSRHASPVRGEGPKEWDPFRKKAWKQGEYGTGNTYNWSGHRWWLGSDFEYYHFVKPNGEEGAVIFWQLGGDPRGNYSDPEVWLGPFSDFIAVQTEDRLDSAEAFLKWNEDFENGLLWALNEMGLFEDSELLPEYVLNSIAERPDLLTPAMLEQIFPNPFGWPDPAVKQAEWWATHQRRKHEKGQKLFWPRLYKGKP